MSSPFTFIRYFTVETLLIIIFTHCSSKPTLCIIFFKEMPFHTIVTFAHVQFKCSKTVTAPSLRLHDEPDSSNNLDSSWYWYTLLSRAGSSESHTTNHGWSCCCCGNLSVSLRGRTLPACLPETPYASNCGGGAVQLQR